MSDHEQKRRADALRAAGKLEQAQRIYEQLFAADRKDLYALSQLAQVRQSRGDIKGAIAAYRTLAEGYASDGFLVRAIATAKRILEMTPDSPESAELLARLNEKRRSSVPPRSASKISSVPTRPSVVLSDLIRDSATGGGALDPATSRVPLFGDLPSAAFAEFLERMPERTIQPGETLIRQGEVGDSFFVLIEGSLRVEKTTEDENAVLLGRLTEGSFFGEMALIDASGVRTASVIAEEPSRVFEISGALLRRIEAAHPTVTEILHRFYAERLLGATLMTHPLFVPFDQAERDLLTSRFQTKTFRSGDTLLAEGASSRYLFVVLSGRLEATKAGQVLGELKPGDVFGEMSLLTGAGASATVRAQQDAMVLRLGSAAFDEVRKRRPEIEERLREISEDRLAKNRELLGRAIV